MTLINVLDPETYVHQNSSLTQYDQNTLSPKERLACMFAWGKAETLLSWLLDKYDIVDGASGDMAYSHPRQQLILYHLVRLEATIINYKNIMDQQCSNTPTTFSLDSLKDQLSSALHHFKGYQIAIYRRDHDPSQQTWPNIWLDWAPSSIKLCPKLEPTNQGLSGKFYSI